MFAEFHPGLTIDIHGQRQITDRAPAYAAADPLHRCQGNCPGQWRGFAPYLLDCRIVTEFTNPAGILLVVWAGLPLGGKLFHI